MGRAGVSVGRVPALLITLTVCAGVGCAGVEPAAQPPTTTRRATTTAPPSTAPARTTSHFLTDPDAILSFNGSYKYTPDENQAIRGYVRAEQAVAVARLAPVDPNLPDLSATVTGRELAARRAKLVDHAAKGHAHTEPKQVFRITIAEVRHESPDRYLIESCSVSDAHPFEVATLRFLEPEGPVATHAVNAVERQGGTWKLELTGVLSTSPGSPRCPRFPTSTPPPSTLATIPTR